MDLHRIFLKSNQKGNMGPYMTYGELPSMPQFHNKGAPFHNFSKSCGNIPDKAFSYPNSFSNFKISPDKILNKAMDFSSGIRKLDNLPAMSLTCIVGGFVDGRQGVWNSDPRGQSFENSLDMLSEFVNQSMELTRTMSCPDPFNFSNFIPTKMPPRKESQPPVKTPPQDTSPTVKMSYADVTKMNLSNVNKNNSVICKPALTVNNVSSQKVNGTPHNKTFCKVISPPQSYKSVNKQNSKPRLSTLRYGTNTTLIQKDSSKPKFQPTTRNTNSRKPLNKRPHCSLKRELGTKKNNQKLDVDGSVWGCENTEVEIFEDCMACSSPATPSMMMRVRSMSSESDCSSEVSECLRNPRVRSISECSVNSIDSEDSFIVFDDCTEDKEVESYEEDSSSDESDDFETITKIYEVEPQADLLQSANSRWATLPFKQTSPEPQANSFSKTCSSLSPCQTLKKVRFACGEAFAKVRKLCVWDFAHRAARIGPWEQAARDRDRFAKRISLLAPILNPVLESKHRKKIYDLHFAPR